MNPRTLDSLYALVASASATAIALSAILDSGLPRFRLVVTAFLVCFVVAVCVAIPVYVSLQSKITRLILRAMLAGASCGLVPSLIAFAALLQGGTLVVNNELMSVDGVPTAHGLFGVLQYLLAFGAGGAFAGALYGIIVRVIDGGSRSDAKQEQA